MLGVIVFSKLAKITFDFFSLWAVRSQSRHYCSANSLAGIKIWIATDTGENTDIKVWYSVSIGDMRINNQHR